MNLKASGAGHRMLHLARSMGVSPEVPTSETIPLLIAIIKADRDARVTNIMGMSNIISTAFGKGSMDPWLDMMYSPSERARGRMEREKQEAVQTEMATVMKMKMLADRYDIKEVRE